MNKTYLRTYYPEEISAEDRLFQAGKECTSVPVATWVKLMLVGLGIGLFGMLVGLADYDAAVFGGILGSAGGLLFMAGIYGIARFNTGLHYLERAELLYNTRVAGREEEEVEQNEKKENGSVIVPPVKTNSAPKTTAGTSNWTCTCGRQNAEYSFACICGVTKQEARKAVPVKTTPAAAAVRTATGWRCSCGKEHPGYVSSCDCGVNKPSATQQ